MLNLTISRMCVKKISTVQKKVYGSFILGFLPNQSIEIETLYLLFFVLLPWQTRHSPRRRVSEPDLIVNLQTWTFYLVTKRKSLLQAMHRH
jgi:hypothetical protein